MENFRQLSLLELASLISDETTDKGVFVRVKTHCYEDDTCEVSDNGRLAIKILEKLVAFEHSYEYLFNVGLDDDRHHENGRERKEQIEVELGHKEHANWRHNSYDKWELPCRIIKVVCNHMLTIDHEL